MSNDEARARLRARFAAPAPTQQPARAAADAAVKRVQKNLSLDQRDVVRLAGLAKRDRLSQARLIARALDAYEALHGKLGG